MPVRTMDDIRQERESTGSGPGMSATPNPWSAGTQTYLQFRDHHIHALNHIVPCAHFHHAHLMMTRRSFVTHFHVYNKIPQPNMYMYRRRRWKLRGTVHHRGRLHTYTRPAIHGRSWTWRCVHWRVWRDSSGKFVSFFCQCAGVCVQWLYACMHARENGRAWICVCMHGTRVFLWEDCK